MLIKNQINIFRSFKIIGVCKTEKFHNRRVLGKIVGKFSELKTVTSVLVCCEIAGNSKSFSDEARKNGTSWCFVQH